MACSPHDKSLQARKMCYYLSLSLFLSRTVVLLLQTYSRRWQGKEQENKRAGDRRISHSCSGTWLR